MSSSWKRQGRSFNSLVKRNTTGVDIRANDRQEDRTNRNSFQIYDLPDSSGSGIASSIAKTKLEFGKCDFGVEASNNFIFNDAYFGIDSSANIQFTDVSGGLGRVGLFFRTANGLPTTDKNQNILLVDASGESLLVRMRPFWEGNTDTIYNIDPSWNYPPGSWGYDPYGPNIGCPTPDQNVGTPGTCSKGGTLGAITIDVGGGNTLSNDGNAAVADSARAQQFAKAIGNPFAPNAKIGASETVNSTGYFWRDYNVWKNYPKLQVIAEPILGADGQDTSSCIVWQRFPKNATTGPYNELNRRDISYNPQPDGASGGETPLIIWSEAGDSTMPGHPEHHHYGLTSATGEGVFENGRLPEDISQNIILEDTSGGRLRIILDVDASYCKIVSGDEVGSIQGIITPVDPSWNTEDFEDYGTITLPVGGGLDSEDTLFLDWKVMERGESLDNLQRPKAVDRANLFISAINRTPWPFSSDPSKNQEGNYLEIDASTNPYDTSGGVILTQNYGGIKGNTSITYTPTDAGVAYPTDINNNTFVPPKDVSSNSNFGGGENDTDISQNIILSDIKGNRIQFVLNVDQSFNDPSGIHLANENYPHLDAIDISSIIVPMDNSSNRATGATRAEQFAVAINKANFDYFFDGQDTSSVDLYIAATTQQQHHHGGEKVSIFQEYPGEDGNNIPEISYNNPSWIELFPLPPAATNEYSLPNYPLKLHREMDCSNCFSGGLNPIDASQTLILKDISGVKITFYLDVDRQNLTDASGADKINDNSYKYYVPVGKGLGMRTSEILVSDEMRASRFQRALQECSIDAPDIPAPGQSSGGGVTNFIALQGQDPAQGSFQYTTSTEHVPLPLRADDAIGGFQPYPPEIGNSKVQITASFEGQDGNTEIIYSPDPNEGSEYEHNTVYPLLEKTLLTQIIFNNSALSGGVNEVSASDKIIRSQNRIIILGGRHTRVLGDQDTNTITIDSTIDISGNQLKVPVWEAGRGAGTTNLAPKYSIQAINPFNEAGVTGAGADYAIAGGERTRAIGGASVSFGTDCEAAGKNSFTMGSLCKTAPIARSSVAMGSSCQTHWEYGAAFGFKGETGQTTALSTLTGIPHNIDNGSGEIIFAIGSATQTNPKHIGVDSHNIFEIDTSGNIWSLSLGNLSSTVTPILRTTSTQAATSGLYGDYGENEQLQVTAQGERSFALGYASEANAIGSFVDGSSCIIHESAKFSVAFGEDNQIGSDTGNVSHYSFMAGQQNIINGSHAAAFGKSCVSANYSFSSGSTCSATGDYSLAMGVNSESPGNYSIALGGANFSAGESSIALGRNSRATGVISGALGCHSTAGGAFSIAIGRECHIGVDASNSYSLGAECITDGKGSITLGYGCKAYGDYCFLGSGGEAATGAHNSIAIGGGTYTGSTGAVSIGYDSSANNPNSIAIGTNCDVSGNFAVGLGFGSKCTGDYSFANGNDCASYDDYTVAFGNESSAYFEGSISMGINCLAKSMRENEVVKEQASIALGDHASTSNFSAWVGSKDSQQEPKDNSNDNAPKFRASRKGIILAIGASGNAVNYLHDDINDPPTYTDASAGNIFELYGDGTMWTASMGVVINPADAISVKMVYAVPGDSSTPLIKVDAGNHEAGAGVIPTPGVGVGAVILGNDSTSEGNYSFNSGFNNHTPGPYCVAMGQDCSSQGLASFALGHKCDASNNYSYALGTGGSTRTSDSGGDISDNELIFAIGVSAEFLGGITNPLGSGMSDASNVHYSGNVFEIDKNGSVWTKALGTLSSTIPALGAVPIGGIIPYAGSQSTIAPTNWLWCDGQLINHKNEPKYAPLFLVIGTTYTNPSVTIPGGFQVPNLSQSWPMGNYDMGITSAPGLEDSVGNTTDIGKTGNITPAASPYPPWASPETPEAPPNLGHPLIMRWLIRYA